MPTKNPVNVRELLIGTNSPVGGGSGSCPMGGTGGLPGKVVDVVVVVVVEVDVVVVVTGGAGVVVVVVVAVVIVVVVVVEGEGEANLAAGSGEAVDLEFHSKTGIHFSR